MATSGITSFTYTRDQIINAALRKLSVLSEGVSANAPQLASGAEALNLLVLQLQPMGLPLWKRTTTAIPMVVGVSNYNLATPKPLKLLQAYRTNSLDQTNINLTITADYDFNSLPGSSTGVPVNITYRPGNTTGYFKVWPTPDSSIPTGSTVYVIYQSEFEIFNITSDTPDFPQEWYLTLVYQLALLLAPEYGIPKEDRQILTAEAEKFLATVLSMGQEDSSVFFSPDRN